MSTALKTTRPPLRLYEATAEWAAVQDEIEEANGELSPELEARLDAIQQSLPNKVEQLVFIHQELRRRAEAASAEAGRLVAMATVRMNAAESLKRYLKHCMDRAGIPKIETDRCKVRIQRNSRPAISWRRDPDDLPAEFRRVVVSLDGAAAYEAWKQDPEGLPDGFLVEQGTHLRIS